MTRGKVLWSMVVSTFYGSKDNLFGLMFPYNSQFDKNTMAKMRGEDVSQVPPPKKADFER